MFFQRNQKINKQPLNGRLLVSIFLKLCAFRSGQLCAVAAEQRHQNKHHADLAFEQLADVLCAEVELVREHPEADVLGQMRLQIARQASDRPLALPGRGPVTVFWKRAILRLSMHAPNSS